MSIAGLLLAGGQSDRMGQDKRYIIYNGKPLILIACEKLVAVCDEVTVLVADQNDVGKLQAHLPADMKFIIDAWPNQGPMGALITGLDSMSHSMGLLMPVDMPLMTTDFLFRLRDFAQSAENQYDAIIPMHNQIPQVTLGIYKKNITQELNDLFQVGERSLFNWCNNQKERILFIQQETWSAWGEAELFSNFNSPHDLSNLRQSIE